MNQLCVLYCISILCILIYLCRCLEFKALIQYPELLINTLPADASLEDVEVDSSLSFLNGFVESALAGGAAAYTAPVDVSSKYMVTMWSTFIIITQFFIFFIL